MVTKCSFCHNFTGASNQKTFLTKVVKEYTLIKVMSWRPLNMELFGHKMFISSQLYFVPINKKLIEQKLLTLSCTALSHLTNARGGAIIARSYISPKNDIFRTHFGTFGFTPSSIYIFGDYMPILGSVVRKMRKWRPF